MLGRPLFVFVFAALLAAIASPVTADTVEVGGGMSTTVKFLDQICIIVPTAVQSLTVKIPVPADVQEFGFAQSVGDVKVFSSRTPDLTRTEFDKSGNRYAVDTFDRPAPGKIVFSIAADSATIAVDLSKPLPSCPLSDLDIPADVACYLKPTSKVQSDDPVIAALADNFLAGATDESTVANRIQQWLQANVNYDPTAIGGPDNAVYVLSHRTAICDGWAHLFLALARADGLPARFVGGYNLGGQIVYPLDRRGSTLTVSCDTKPHSWVEVWFPGTGWVPFEPQGSAGFVDSHHLSVWSGEDSMSVENMVTWTTFTSDNQSFVLSEEEDPITLSDHIDVTCCNDHAGSANYTALERRRPENADETFPSL